LSLDQNSIPQIMNRLLAPVRAASYQIGGYRPLPTEPEAASSSNGSSTFIAVPQAVFSPAPAPPLFSMNAGFAFSAPQPTVPVPLTPSTGFRMRLPDCITSIELRDPKVDSEIGTAAGSGRFNFLSPTTAQGFPSASSALSLYSLRNSELLPKPWPKSLQSLVLRLSSINNILSLDMAWPVGLTSLDLHVTGLTRTYLPFKFLSPQLVHLRITSETFFDIPCNPGHVQHLPATLETFDCLGITFPASDLPLLPKGIKKLHFLGGLAWSDYEVGQILETLPAVNSLKLRTACLTGAFLPPDTTEVTAESLLKSAENHIQSLLTSTSIRVKRWMLNKPLQLPKTVTTLHLIPTIKTRGPMIDPTRKIPDLTVLLPLPPSLTDLSFAITDQVHLANFGPKLPRSLQRLCIAAHEFQLGHYHWTTFPRGLKSLRLYHTNSDVTRSIHTDDAIGLPPQLEELILSKLSLPDSAIPNLPKSITALDFADTAPGTIRDPLLPWAKYN
jgi:hypothetical protein